MDCLRCGTCCVAPDIAALDKPLGVRCPHLTEQCRCAIYEERPPICRRYAADALCRAIAAPSLEERVARYLDHFGLGAEAEQIRARGLRTMAEARRLEARGAGRA